MDIENLSKTIIEKDADDELIWMTVSKYALFMSYGKIGIDAKSLYEHYQFTCILQKTNSVWAGNKYCRQGLDWGRDKFDKAKALLIDLGLIEINQTRASGKFDKVYIKVKMKRIDLEPADIDRMPEIRQAVKAASVETATNALTNNGNALTNNGNALTICTSELESTNSVHLQEKPSDENIPKDTKKLPNKKHTEQEIKDCNEFMKDFSLRYKEKYNENFEFNGKEYKYMYQVMKKYPKEIIKKKMNYLFQNKFYKFTPTTLATQWNNIVVLEHKTNEPRDEMIEKYGIKMK